MQDKQLEKAVFGGGCFWCIEAVLKRLKGVESVTSGYAGGEMENPDYHSVSTGETGHAEVVQAEFDPAQINYRDLLNVFFAMHDPTTLNRQGNDVGEQYRSVIFYTTPEQKTAAQEFIKQLTADQVFDDPIITEVEPLRKFYKAENYHQNYYDTNPAQPYCQVVINPKLAKLRQKFAPLLRPE
jgi:peptide-methionine (S)-S-oxide reductase